MKNIILYKNNNGKYEVSKFDDLKKGHEAFSKEMLKGEYSYLELGIDKIDIDGTYPIIRKLYK